MTRLGISPAACAALGVALLLGAVRPILAGDEIHPAERFIREAAELAPDDPGLGAKLEEAWAKARERGETVQEFVHDTLLERNATYASAFEKFEKGEEEAAEREFRDILAGSPEPFLASEAQYQLGRILLRLDVPESAAAIFLLLKRMFGPSTGIAMEADFYAAYALAKIPMRDEAKASFQSFLEAHKDAPERFRIMARLLIRELEGEGGGPLLELSEKMNSVTRRLKREMTGKTTQAKQKEIIETLERLIDEMREKEKKGKGSGSGSGSSTPRTAPSNPLDRSQLPSGGAKAENLKRSPREAGESWGRLKEKDREKVLQMLKKRFPTRYRELLEQYFKSLSKGKKD